jgi:uncharacterized protein YjbJ (UPF0337 family)
MSNKAKAKATAKDSEGKLESAFGDLTDDKGHQLKGKAKQVQASAMNAAEEIKDAAKTMIKKITDSDDTDSEETDSVDQEADELN